MQWLLIYKVLAKKEEVDKVMDINVMRGITTTILLLLFIGFIFWAFSKDRKKAFSEAELLPFDNDELTQIKEIHEDGTHE